MLMHYGPVSKAARIPQPAAAHTIIPKPTRGKVCVLTSALYPRPPSTVHRLQMIVMNLDNLEKIVTKRH